MATIMTDKPVKIRKERRCHGCARRFEKGSTLQVIKSVDEGKFYSDYWCKTCQNYWSKYMNDGEEIGCGELRSEDREAWEEVRKATEDG
ncbi:hypothetical protein [Bacillus thuringiensis]|uniref:hypothetical protein n=1 Tax=Bacillus thuringiensis TaxID=1428 RepID=UPI000BFD7EA8|nr:hypothetical protein [Bacillus thuringiensis]PGT89819.1 hypothetical protein COD17_08710 [Bacillus thuringiensis]